MPDIWLIRYWEKEFIIPFDPDNWRPQVWLPLCGIQLTGWKNMKEMRRPNLDGNFE
jgi:hypothetical protein